MRDDDVAETTGELEVTIAGVAGTSIDALAVAVTIVPRGGDLEELTSMVARVGRDDWEVVGSYREWIVAITTAADGTPYAVTADGALRIGAGDHTRRLPLPVRRGLAAVWLAGDGELLVCGPGALGRIRLGAGRIAVDVTFDDGVGDAGAVAGRDGVHGAIAVGTHGAVWSYDGDEWTAHETAARETLLDVAWHDDGRAYVTGAEGGLYVWDGIALSPRLRHGGALTSVASYRGQLYVTRDRAAVARVDGDRLVDVHAMPATRVRAIADHLVAWGGTLLARFDGAAWSGGPLHLP